jgi:hypothetical protein
MLGVYAYCRDWHGGQWSREYRIMCRIGERVRFSRIEEYTACLATEGYEKARDVYMRLVESQQGKEGSGYIACACCAYEIVENLSAEGVTYCDDCQALDCCPGNPCESIHDLRHKGADS